MSFMSRQKRIMSAQIVLLTGCSSGIGFALAKRLSLDPDHRYIVIATVIAMSEKTQLEAAVGGALGKMVFIQKLDVTNDKDITTVVDGILEKYGRIDVLVNVAGLVITGVPEHVTRERMVQIFNVNVFGPIRLSQTILPHMKKRKSGKIITISSQAGKTAFPYMDIYCSTKFAVEGFFEGLAVAVRSFNIRVCLIEPGKINTGMMDQILAGCVTCAQDPTVNEIDRRQLGLVNDYIGAQPGDSPDMVAKEIVSRCFDVEDPVLRHLLLPADLHEEFKAGLSDLTGETGISTTREKISGNP